MSPQPLGYYDAEAVARALSYPLLITALREGIQAPYDAFPRTVHTLADGGRLLALMPVSQHDAIAVKIATVVAENPAVRNLPAIQAVVVLLDGGSGMPIAMFDGTEITRRRTAATSALAASYLSHKDARTLLILGTGALPPHLAAAYATVRSLESIEIWGRRPERAAATAVACRALCPDTKISVAPDLAAAVARADIVACATSAHSPVLQGRWLREGTHVDLMGSFSPAAREADDDVVRGARIFVDSLGGALSEAGDLLIPLGHGVLTREHILGELADLCSGRRRGRENSRQVTVFKSVGHALTDLLAARQVLERGNTSSPTRHVSGETGAIP